jgi:uncharacterized membrane protein YfcA
MRQTFALARILSKCCNRKQAMSQNKPGFPDNRDDPQPAEYPAAACSAAISFEHPIERARWRRACDLRSVVEAMPGLVRAHPIAVAVAASVVSVAAVIAYASLLSRTGIPAAAPAMLAVLLASTLSSIAGFAFSAICGVMLLQLMDDPVQAVQIMMVCSIAIQSLSVAVLRRDIDWRTLPVLVAGGIPGLPFGLWLLLHLGLTGAREAIGGLLTAYAVYALLKRPVALRAGGTVLSTCVGFSGGVTGGLAGFPGAAVTIWCGMKGWDKRRQRGVYQPFILIMQVLALALMPFMRSGGFHGGVVTIELLKFVPVALLGTWFGLTLFERLSDRTFIRTVNALLLVSGVGLLI